MQLQELIKCVISGIENESIFGTKTPSNCLPSSDLFRQPNPRWQKGFREDFQVWS